MMGQQFLGPGNFTHHLMARKYQKKRYRKVIIASLMLTSMVDMFSLLVIFLLQSFSTSPEIMALTKGVQLPAAISAAAPVDAPVLAISAEEVLLDQKSVGETLKVYKRPDQFIDGLNDLKQSWVKAHPKEEFKGDIHLQADKNLSSALISQYVNILISQGFSSIHLAVTTGQ